MRVFNFFYVGLLLFFPLLRSFNTYTAIFYIHYNISSFDVYCTIFLDIDQKFFVFDRYCAVID